MGEQEGRRLDPEAVEIIRTRLEYVHQYFPLIRDAYNNGYNDPELDPLRHEICLCILFGLFQAAITLTNHFLEHLLKYSLIVNDSKEQKEAISKVAEGSPSVQQIVDSFAKARESYVSADLGDNINAACRKGLITKEDKKRLHEIREKLRNAYSHADKDKTFGEATIGATALRVAPGGIEAGPPEEVRLADLLVGQGIAQAMMAQNEAPEYFLYVHKLAEQISVKLYGKARP